MGAAKPQLAVCSMRKVRHFPLSSWGEGRGEGSLRTQFPDFVISALVFPRTRSAPSGHTCRSKVQDSPCPCPNPCCKTNQPGSPPPGPNSASAKSPELQPIPTSATFTPTPTTPKLAATKSPGAQPLSARASNAQASHPPVHSSPETICNGATRSKAPVLAPSPSSPVAPTRAPATSPS